MDDLIDIYAKRMFDRHKKKRGCTLIMAKGRLQTVCRKLSPAKAEELLKQIDTAHAAWCESEAWTKDGGEYQRGLDGFLIASKRRWEVLPDPEIEDTGEDLY